MEGGTVYYECDALKVLARGQAMEAFRQGLRDARGDLRGITEKHLRALLALMEARPGGLVALPGGWEGIRQKGGILLRPMAVRRKERTR